MTLDLLGAMPIDTRIPSEGSDRSAAEHHLAEEIIDALPGVFYLYDEQGRFLRWNRSFERVTGYSSAEIAAKHPLDFFAGGDRERVQSKIAEVFAHGEASLEAGFIAKSGIETPYFFTGKQLMLAGTRCLAG